jgi:hypothetical protein
MFKTQKTLDSFFKNKDNNTNYELKRYFYLIWENKFSPNVEAYWTNTRPVKINFIEQIKCDYIKKDHCFYICGYFIDIDEKYNLPKEITYKNIHYLKSHLQKCVRKQNYTFGVPTALHMMKLDLNDFLRRLPIIMIEDVYLHNSFSTIIWLMIANATPNFKFKRYIYEWLLGVVYLLCIINEKDIIDDEIIVANNNAIKNNKIIDILNTYNKLNQNEYSLLYSIHLRIAFGGMRGDLEMLENYAYVWEQRFINKDINKNINNIELRPISINVSKLEITDWDLSAIDYHCNQKIIGYILKKYDDIDESELKKLIWYNSSCLNSRVKNIPYNEEKWDEIKKYVEKTQKYLLESE